MTVSYKASNDFLEIRAAGTECNFDLNVTCFVTDASIQGNVKTNVIAQPSVQVGFVGAAVALDPAYTSQRAACFSAMVAKYKGEYRRLSNVPGPGDPIDQRVIARLPAYARLERYGQAREAFILSKMAKAVLPAAESRAFAISLLDAIPAVAVTAHQTHHGEELPAPHLGETSSLSDH